MTKSKNRIPSTPQMTAAKRNRSQPKPALEPGEAIIPPGLKVHVCPGYLAPHERIKIPVGGFVSDWLVKRGRP